MAETKDHARDQSHLKWATPLRVVAPMMAVVSSGGLVGTLALAAFGMFEWSLVVCGVTIVLILTAGIDVLLELVRNIRVIANRIERGESS